MSAAHAQPLEFKFHWLNDKGAQIGILRKKGSFDGQTLVLEQIQIPAAVILEVAVRENRMAISALTEGGGAATLLLAPASAKQALQLKERIDVARSAVWAANEQKSLEAAGQAAGFRAEQCPHCGATLSLSNMDVTPQLFCRFCHTLSTIDPTIEPPAGEQHYRLCDECGMFSKPRRFTIFYFYFLLVVYGWYSRSTWRCPACMRGEAWKMLFGNLLFVLGVPVALVQLFRSYGGTDAHGPFKGLDRGNLKARQGDFAGALASYRAIMERIPNCAGLKYNLGFALLQQGDAARAADSFEAALDDCANYAPAYARLRPLLEQQGNQVRLKELDLQWGAPAAAEPVETPHIAG